MWVLWKEREKKLLQAIARAEHNIEYQRGYLETYTAELEMVNDAYAWFLGQLKKTASGTKKVYKKITYEISPKQLERFLADLHYIPVEIRRLKRGIDADNYVLLKSKAALKELRRRRSRRS